MRGSQPLQQADLRRDQVPPLAHRHPEHPIGKGPPDRRIPGQHRGQHGLPDSALSVQPQRLTGHAHRAIARTQDRLAEASQLPAGYERGRRQRNIIEFSQPLASRQRHCP